MDSTAEIESVNPSDVGSEVLVEERAAEKGDDGEFGGRAVKKARMDRGLVRDMKAVAEIVLVLATMGKMRAGRNPTQAEMDIMMGARTKLAEVCEGFAPKDVFPRDTFGAVIEDLGFSKLKEQRLGFQPPKTSIAEKFLLTKQKIEKPEILSQSSATHSSQRLQTKPGASVERHETSSHAVQMSPLDKPSHGSISAGSFKPSSTVVHVSAANSTSAVPYQLRSNTDRSSSLSFAGAEKPHFKVEKNSNANSYGDHAMMRTPTRAFQLRSVSSVNAKPEKDIPSRSSLKGDGSADLSTPKMTHQPMTSKHLTTQSTHGKKPSAHQNVVQSHAYNSHNDIGKIVLELLQPNSSDQRTWTPPSRDYMTKTMTCQICTSTINDVDSVLVCDACEKGFHLKCLHLNNKNGIPKGEWHCQKCLTVSNGKPLPPKYGRVMRNINAPKEASTTSSEKEARTRSEKAHREKITENGSSGSHGVSRVSQETSGDNRCDEVKQDEQDNPTETESSTVDIKRHSASSDGLHVVDWVGDMQQVVDGKTYYQSCCINGVVYKIHEYALLRLNNDMLTPSRIQAMCEDEKTTSRWVVVKRCYFPRELPEEVVRPSSPDSCEVYDSNHEETLMAGLIQGPCEVLPPSKFFKESERTSRLGKGDNDGLRPIFLCKWFYDESKGLLQDAST